MIPALLTVIPVLLILRQPDLGTAIILMLVFFSVTSLSTIATTRSPFSAVSCCRITTKSPSAMWSSIIDCPFTRRT